VNKASALIPTCLCLAALVAPLYGAEAPKPKPKDPKAAATAELQGRIRKLIKDVGDLDYDIRTAASKELIKIGRPALELLEAATKDKDAERVWRAKELVYYISRLPKPTKVDRKCTNGYMPVHGTVKQLQTFTPDADVEIDAVRFRAARTLAVPFGDLQVELHAGDKPGDKALATATFEYEWTDANNKVHGVTRFMQWFEAAMKLKLRKGATYCLVFSSARSGATSPWLVNCFYRDTFAAGKHRRQDGDKPEDLGKYDLVFELRAADKTVLSSVPDKVDLTKREEFGVGHDGTDLRKRHAGQILVAPF